jgi:tRNA(fMet)-specific endonuclease VapC
MTALSPYLLDTTVTLAIIRGRKLAAYIDATYKIRTQTTRPLISVVTLGELHALSLKLGWGENKIKTLHTLEEELVVVDLNRSEIIRAYAEVDKATEPRGKVLSKNDLWIAATAKATGATLLTSDKDFDPLFPDHINRIWIDPVHGKE